MPVSSRLKDLLLYSGVAGLLVIALLVFAFRQAHTGGSPQLPIKWLGLLITSVTVFGYGIRSYSSFYRKPKFWVLLTLFALVHFCVSFAILAATPEVPLLYIAPVAGIECLVLSVYLSFFLKSR